MEYAGIGKSATRCNRVADNARKPFELTFSRPKDTTTTDTGQIGFTQIPNFVIRDSSLSIGARLLIAVLKSYAWNGSTCYPGQERLAAELGVSSRTIRRLLCELRDAGLLIIQRGEGRRTNTYVLMFENEETNRKKLTRNNGTATSMHQDMSVLEINKENKTKTGNKKKNNNVGSKDETTLRLSSAGVKEPTASLLAAQPHISLEYVEAHLTYGRLRGDDLPLIIHRMQNNDDPPSKKAIKSLLDREYQRNPDSEASRRRFLKGWQDA